MQHTYHKNGKVGQMVTETSDYSILTDRLCQTPLSGPIPLTTCCCKVPGNTGLRAITHKL